MVAATGVQPTEYSGSAKAITMQAALNQALRYALNADPSVVLIGEDIGGKKGGVFVVTKGLAQEFGERVENSQLDEASIAGEAIGLAMSGLRVIAEFQFAGFSYPGFDQIVSHASRMRNRTRGVFSCPIVYRMPYGAGMQTPEHHCESPEAFYAHIPGLRVVIPSTPKRAYGLLLSAIRSNDPVIFLEPTRMYWDKDVILDDGIGVPLDKCIVEREGEQVTLVAWGAMMREAREASGILAQEGISVELVDVATITPLDFDTIHESVQKTHRAVVVHEAPMNGGYGAEIVARLAEEALLDLYAAPKRVTAPDVIPPYTSRKEGKARTVIPQTEDIVAAVREVIRCSV